MNVHKFTAEVAGNDHWRTVFLSPWAVNPQKTDTIQDSNDPQGDSRDSQVSASVTLLGQRMYSLAHCFCSTALSLSERESDPIHPGAKPLTSSKSSQQYPAIAACSVNQPYWDLPSHLELSQNKKLLGRSGKTQTKSDWSERSRASEVWETKLLKNFGNTTFQANPSSSLWALTHLAAFLLQTASALLLPLPTKLGSRLAGINSNTFKPGDTESETWAKDDKFCKLLQVLTKSEISEVSPKNLPIRTFLYGLDLCAMVAEAPRWLEPQATRVLFHQAGYKLLLDPVDSLEVKMEIFACVSTMTLEKLLPKVSLCLVKCVLMYSPNSSLNEQIVGPNIWFHTPTAGDTLLLHSAVAVAQRKGERSNPPGG